MLENVLERHFGPGKASGATATCKSCNKVCVAEGLKLCCGGLGIKGSAGEELNGAFIG